ncbi:glutamate--tRNA ligase [Psychroflexus halocasei]|uniref:Glutamate--tRNA ligase n=1 Tax=Psychroflexus halocasei TaxID=908615 RepID=A0A1H4BFF9_9FLAO|nr:glutamate--tRNA ligase [Psychroflexus halocasei]SEA46870.1 glutamyl-tRNA synthetase [Psychroflexus halocasei]
MSTSVRVRFAPSPTGPLHIGGLRTALYNYLFAKKHQGTFVLRIEDTDQNRFVEGAEDYIVESLNWSGIPYDEGPGKEGEFGPYKQSLRKDIYKNYVDELINNGRAYYAFDTTESLQKLREEAEANGEKFAYGPQNRLSLDNSLKLSSEDLQKRLDANEAYVIRFKTSPAQKLFLKDEIRGHIEVDTSVLDDKILFKADGLPTYHMANIVDDHLMEITHVIRGEEWLPSLPLHVALYEAFGWEPPKFAHLPLILKPNGKGKLSKRDGDKLGIPVFPLEWKDPKTGSEAAGYREGGYLPETLINTLALLGWNDATEKEFYKIEELIDRFELKRVHKSGAKFDPEKLKWFQQHYLQEADLDFLVKEYEEILKEKNLQTETEYVKEVVSTIRERAVFVDDFWELSSFYFVAPSEFNKKSSKKAWKTTTSELMTEFAEFLSGLKDFSEENLEKEIKNWITSHELGFGKVMQPLRLSLVGAMQGPSVFHIATSIGQEETLKRLKTAINHFS